MTRSLSRRLDAVAGAIAPSGELPPTGIEQDAPGAPVRFYRNQPMTWGGDGPGEMVEMPAAEFIEKWGHLTFLRWADQPWAPCANADGTGRAWGEGGSAVPTNWPKQRPHQP